MSAQVVQSSAWQRWVRQPQKVWLRRAIFQVHLWAGIGLGLYVFFISVTGSVLVYRNELYVAVTPDVVTPSATPAEAAANVPPESRLSCASISVSTTHMPSGTLASASAGVPLSVKSSGVTAT